MPDELDRSVAGQRLRADRLGEGIDRIEAEAEELAERLGLPDTPDDLAGAEQRDDPGPLPSFEEVRLANERFLEAEGIEVTSLDKFLTVEEIEFLESFDPLGREEWTPSDFVAVGLAGVIGVAATAFDDQVDAAVKKTPAGLKNTDLIKRWEREARGLSIDHTGPKFGGPGHRVRSAGHDIGRPFAAIRQIREGTFEGWYWEDKIRITRVVPGYTEHEQIAEALMLWFKHLTADFVTSTSLPLPWWSRLYEMPDRDLRKLAHDLYLPADGFGINLRSMVLSKAVPVMTTELIIRSKLWIEAYRDDGTVRLSPNRKLKRDEMLFAGHALTGAACLGKVVFTCYATSSPLGLRHLNVISLGRAGWLGWRLAAERRRRTELVPEWDELILTDRLPWQLDELAAIGEPVVV